MTYKVKIAMSYDASERCWPISREWNILETPKWYEVSRSKVKVTRSTNDETGSASYLPNGNAYKLETWYTDGVQRPISPTSSKTSKIWSRAALPSALHRPCRVRTVSVRVHCRIGWSSLLSARHDVTCCWAVGAGTGTMWTTRVLSRSAQMT